MSVEKKYAPLERLAETPLFAGFTQRELEQLPALKPQLAAHRKNELVIYEDSRVNKLALVLSGRFTATKLASDNEGERRISFERDKGTLLGLCEFQSSVGTWVHSYTCSHSGVLLWFDIRQAILDAHTPEQAALSMRLRDNLERVRADEMVRMTCRLDVLSVFSLRNRVLYFLKMQQNKQHNAWVRLKFNKQRFASYLAVDRSTLSRELQRMQQDGLLEIKDENCYKINEISEKQKKNILENAEL